MKQRTQMDNNHLQLGWVRVERAAMNVRRTTAFSFPWTALCIVVTQFETPNTRRLARKMTRTKDWFYAGGVRDPRVAC